LAASVRAIVAEVVGKVIVVASVPARVSVFDTVRLFVPKARVAVPDPVKVTPFTVVGVIAPRVREMAGVVVAVATVPETPFAVVTDTLVTVPVPLERSTYSLWVVGSA
jgi:hypothetical protein